MGDPKMVVLSRQEFVDLLKNTFQSAFKPIENDIKSINESYESMNEDLKAVDENLISIEGKLRSLTVSHPAPTTDK
jgi:prefoldin subunit 5